MKQNEILEKLYIKVLNENGSPFEKIHQINFHIEMKFDVERMSFERRVPESIVLETCKIDFSNQIHNMFYGDIKNKLGSIIYETNNLEVSTYEEDLKKKKIIKGIHDLLESIK